MTTQELKDELRNRGFYTDNLWHVDDVKSRFKCDYETAYDILDGVLSNEWIVEQINVSIGMDCEDEGLEEIEED